MSPERVHIGLPPAAKLVIAGGALLLVSMVALLIAQLSVLGDSREHIVAQDRKINRIVKGADPVLGELEPAAGDIRSLVRQAEPLARETRPLVREARPLVRDLRETMLPVLRELDAAELVPMARLTAELIRGLRDSEFIPRTLRAADLVPEMRWILGETLRVQRGTLRTQRRTLTVQRQTREIQKQTLAIQQRLLAVQEEALVHVRSIDRKTGPTVGQPPPAAPLPR